MSAKKYNGLEAELYDLFRGSDDFDEIGYYVDLALNKGGYAWMWVVERAVFLYRLLKRAWK